MCVCTCIYACACVLVDTYDILLIADVNHFNVFHGEPET